MQYLKTREGCELIVDDEEKVMALKFSPEKPWIRSTQLGKKYREFHPLMIAVNDKTMVLTHVLEEKITGLVDGSFVGEYSSAPSLSSLTLDIVESKQFGPRNQINRTIKNELNGNLLLTENVDGAMKAIDKYGIESVVDSITPGEVALLINHLKKIGQESRAEEAYSHFEKFVYGSHAFTDMPTQYMKRFVGMINENHL